MPRPTDPSYSDNEIFFDHLNNLKQNNLESVLVGESVIDGGINSIPPMPNQPSMEDFKEEIRTNEEIRAEQERAWTGWTENRAFQQLGYVTVAYVAYSYFLK